MPPRASRSGLADTISNGTIVLCRSAIDPGHGCRRVLKILANELYPRLEDDDGLSFLARLDNTRADKPRRRGGCRAA